MSLLCLEVPLREGMAADGEDSEEEGDDAEDEEDEAAKATIAVRACE